MYVGLAVSLLLHSGLLAGPSCRSIRRAIFRRRSPTSLPIDFVTISELNKMRHGSRQSKLKDATPKENTKADPALKETKKPKAVTPPPAKSQPPPDETAKEEVKPVEQKLAAAVPPKSEPKAEPKVEPQAEPKPEPDKAALDKKLAELAKEPLPGPTPEELKKIEDDKLAAQKDAEQKAEAEKRAEAERKAEAEKKAEAKRKAEDEARPRRTARRRKSTVSPRRSARPRRKRRPSSSAWPTRRKPTRRKSARRRPRPSSISPPVGADRQVRAEIGTRRRTRARCADQEQGASRGGSRGPRSDYVGNRGEFLAGLMRQAVSRCWNINAGLEGIDGSSSKFRSS